MYSINKQLETDVMSHLPGSKSFEKLQRQPHWLSDTVVVVDWSWGIMVCWKLSGKMNNHEEGSTLSKTESPVFCCYQVLPRQFKKFPNIWCSHLVIWNLGTLLMNMEKNSAESTTIMLCYTKLFLQSLSTLHFWSEFSDYWFLDLCANS